MFEPEYGSVPPQSVIDQFFSDAPEANTRDLGVYVSDQLSIDRWRITLGLRQAYMATCLARGDCFPGEDRTIVARAVMKFR